jgi:hypothetical protein
MTEEQIPGKKQGWSARRRAITITLISLASCVTLWACGWADLEYARVTFPSEELGPPVSEGAETSATIAAFDTGHISALAKLFPRDTPGEVKTVWDNCAIISPDGRANVPVEAATPSLTRVVLRGHAKNDPHHKVMCTFSLDWTVDNSGQYWTVGFCSAARETC